MSVHKLEINVNIQSLGVTSYIIWGTIAGHGQYMAEAERRCSPVRRQLQMINNPESCTYMRFRAPPGGVAGGKFGNLLTPLHLQSRNKCQVITGGVHMLGFSRAF